VIDAAVFGRALHLVVRDAAAAIPLIKMYLVDHGITVSLIDKIHPTLEDVFVSLTGATDSGKEWKA
jgi:ABC-2 type transport system ATP-binding protein